MFTAGARSDSVTVTVTVIGIIIIIIITRVTFNAVLVVLNTDTATERNKQKTTTRLRRQVHGKTKTRTHDNELANCQRDTRAIGDRSVDWVRVREGETGEHLLIDGHEQTGVRRSQLRLLHREVSVEVAHVVSRRLRHSQIGSALYRILLEIAYWLYLYR